MRFFALLVTVISIESVAAKCYGSGDTWGSGFKICSGGKHCFTPGTMQPLQFVRDACYKNKGMFTGWYEPGQTKAMCPRDGTGTGLLFQVQNLNQHAGFDLGDNDCYKRLSDLITGCDHGGSSIIAGWRFRADPGNC